GPRTARCRAEGRRDPVRGSMPRKREQRKASSVRRSSSSGAIPWWAALFPVLVAIVLCLPDLPLGYIWDDYYFLTFRGHSDYRAYLLPDPHAAFYRPISQ